jgi:hypothetical protein
MASAEGHSEVTRCRSVRSKGMVFVRGCGPRGFHRHRTDDDRGGAGLLLGWTRWADLVSGYWPPVPARQMAWRLTAARRRCAAIARRRVGRPSGDKR